MHNVSHGLDHYDEAYTRALERELFGEEYTNPCAHAEVIDQTHTADYSRAPFVFCERHHAWCYAS